MAPAAAAERAPAASPTLASSWTSRPSLVAPSPRKTRTRLASSLARRRASSLGLTVIWPLVPSTRTMSPSWSWSVTSEPVPTIAGMPRARARMAVWEVGPPSEVIKATTFSGSSRAVSAGARSSATRTKGSGSTGIPGMGASVRTATMRSRTSATSRVRSAMWPPRDFSMAARVPAASQTARSGTRRRSRIMAWAEEVRVGSAAICAVVSRRVRPSPLAWAAESSRFFLTLWAAAATRSHSSSRSLLGSRVAISGSMIPGAMRATGPATRPGLTPIPVKEVGGASDNAMRCSCGRGGCGLGPIVHGRSRKCATCATL